MTAYTDSLSLFFGNNENLLKAVMALCSIKNFKAGDTILAQEDEGDEVFCLLEGQVRALVLSIEGHEIWLDDFGPGEIFGEMAAIGGFERSSNIVALTNLTVAVFPGNQFLALMRKEGSLGLKVSEVLVKRIRATTQRMFELSALSAPGRVYAELLRISEALEEEGVETRIIKPVPVAATFALSVNSTRETVTRAISDLKRLGLIRREEDALIILAPKKLGGLIN